MAATQDAAPRGAFARVIDATTSFALVCAEIILVLMLGMIALEVFVRNAFNYSLQVTDELSGYMLVALTFLSLGVSLRDGAFFRVEFVFERLPQRARAWVSCVFILAAIIFSAILDWHLFQLVKSSFRRGTVEASLLATPLWIPQVIMPIGTTAMIVVLIGMLARQASDAVRGRA